MTWQPGNAALTLTIQIPTRQSTPNVFPFVNGNVYEHVYLHYRILELKECLNEIVVQVSTEVLRSC